MTNEKVCDICGYDKSQTVIIKCPDGMLRCWMCRQRAAHGKYIPDREFQDMKRAHQQQIINQYDKWWEELKND
jgi:hypothetical protein